MSKAHSTPSRSSTVPFNLLPSWPRIPVRPQILINPISYPIVNLIPFNQPVYMRSNIFRENSPLTFFRRASAVVFVGLIYLSILSFYIVMIAHGAREVSGLVRILRRQSLITFRMTSSALGYFFLSVSDCWHISRRYYLTENTPETNPPKFTLQEGRLERSSR